MSEAVAKEVAEAEFLRFTELMDLDLNPAHWDSDDKKTFEDAKGKFVKAVMRGDLVVDDKGQPVYTPSSEPRDAITFHEPDGAALMATDLAKKNHDMAKGFKVLAAITKTPETRFSKMPQRDLKVCNAILSLFLGSA